MPYSNEALTSFQKAVQSLWNSCPSPSRKSFFKAFSSDNVGLAVDTSLEADDWEHLASWKCVGYPGFSRWLGSSSGRMAMRKFEDLNIRVLLLRQNEIVELERQLAEMYDFTMGLPLNQGGCGSLRLDEGSPRALILDEISVKLLDYNKQLECFMRLQDRPLASRQQFQDLQQWFVVHQNAIEGPEQEFAFHQHDLITAGRPRRGRFGKLLKCLSCPDLQQQAADVHVTSNIAHCTPSTRFQKAIQHCFSMLAPLTMLLIPTWLMAFACDCASRLTIVTSFTVLFGLFVSFRKELRPSQQGVAIAGYFGLLILILGLTPVWGGSTDGLTSLSKDTRLFVLPIMNHTTADNSSEVALRALNGILDAQLSLL